MDLLRLALSRPKEALQRATKVLEDNPSIHETVMAHRAIGVVLREFGNIDAAIAELRLARRLARRSGDPELEADVLGTLGVALSFAGHSVAACHALDASVERSAGFRHDQALFRRGAVRAMLGRHHEALPDLNSAINAFHAAGEIIWEARGRTDRATCYLALGQIRRAAADWTIAERLFLTGGQELESADAITHRGILALRVGDIPEALSAFDEASERFRRIGTPDFDLASHRCAALLAGGLPREALQAVDDAVEGVERLRCRPIKRAELLLAASGSALAAGKPDVAECRAVHARRLFLRQGRFWWAAHARLAQVRARFATGVAPGRLLGDARRCVAELEGHHSPELPLAQLTAGRVALATGRGDLARQYLSAAAAGRRRGPALARALAWLAEALDAQAGGDPRRMMRACHRGLEVIDEYRTVLGSSELRAQVTAHGAELAALGQRRALQLNRPLLLLQWSERWRSVALDVPAVRPPPDEALRARLSAMRAIQAPVPRTASDRGAAALPSDHHRLEREIRAHAWRARATAEPGRIRQGGRLADREFDPCDLIDEVADGRLLEIVEVEGRLQVIVCGSGAVRLVTAGSMVDAVREVTYARFGLKRLSTRITTADDATATDRLLALGATIERVLLGDAVGEIADRPVVVVPPARLHAVPWALLPCLRAAEFSVAPSAAMWLRVRRAPAPRTPGGPTVLVRGPGLASQGAEVPQLADWYGADGDRPVILESGSATVAQVLQAIDGAGLVHIAAHGTFRDDSPLFSSLSLDDGPLTLYDLEQLRRGPRRVVLSSCDSGTVAPAGADEILGLASSMLPLGTDSIVASVVPVNDIAVVPLMLGLHRRLQEGAGVAAALRDVRRGVAGDPLGLGTACSFIALGAC
jgi:tetratricopeptide (TPR) repeat protein